MGSSPFVISFPSQNERGIIGNKQNLGNNSIFTGTNISFIWLCLYWNNICDFFFFLFFIFNSTIRFVFFFRQSHALTHPATLYRTKRLNDDSILKWYEKWCDHAISCFVIICQFAVFFLFFSFYFNKKKKPLKWIVNFSIWHTRRTNK